jgi:hypothetical protein
VLLSEGRGKSLRFWMFLETLAHTGRRMGEVLGLEWPWLNLTAEVRHFQLPTTKTHKQNLVPLNARLRTEVWTLEHVGVLKQQPLAPDGCTREAFPMALPVGVDDVRQPLQQGGVDEQGLPLLLPFEGDSDACEGHTATSSLVIVWTCEREHHVQPLPPRNEPQLQPLLGRLRTRAAYSPHNPPRSSGALARAAE